MHKFLLGVLVGIAETIGTCLAIDKLETKKNFHNKVDKCDLMDENESEIEQTVQP